MTTDEIDAWLHASLEDRRLSRNERRSLADLAAAVGPGVDRDPIRRRAFEAARAALTDPNDAPVLDWLEGVVKALRDEPPAATRSVAEAHFCPGDACRVAITARLKAARRSVDACVFTITDDRLADALLDAHRRGVPVRVITDDSKAEDLGSDADRLASSGIPVRLDRSPFHMHHKFVVVDGSILITGSYNWTRGAANDNHENLVVTDDPRLVSPFLSTFDRLWSTLGS